MKIKLFNAPTINEAMAQVKKELGRDAVILHTRRLRKGGLFGFFGQEMVEVMAAVDSAPANKVSSEKKPKAEKKSAVIFQEAVEPTQPQAQLQPQSEPQMQLQPQPQLPPQTQLQPQSEPQIRLQPQPQLPPQTQPQPQSEPQMQLQPQPQLPPQTQLQPQSEPQMQLQPQPQLPPQTQPQPQSEPQMQLQPQPQLPPQTQMQPQSEPQMQLQPQAQLPPQTQLQPQSEPQMQLQPQPQLPPKAQLQPQSEPQMQLQPQPQLPPKAQLQPQSEPQIQPQQPKPKPKSKPKPQLQLQEQDIPAIKMEISNVRKMMEEFIEYASKMDKNNLSSTKKQSPLVELLLRNDIDPIVATSLVEGIPKEQAKLGIKSEFAKQVLIARIAQYFKDINGIQISDAGCKKVAFIGATGVGKTTTIAKLAANFAIKQGYKVAVITADTYRIAAIEQLRIYADIIGIPIEIIYSPTELKAAFNRHNDKDLVLVDTAGRSPNNLEQLAELKELLDVDHDIETHLVLSSTIRYKEALDMINKFSGCSMQKILFTKLDESYTLGTLLNLAYYIPSTLGYITMGQNVPEDIELVDSEKLAAMMMREF